MFLPPPHGKFCSILNRSVRMPMKINICRYDLFWPSLQFNWAFVESDRTILFGIAKKLREPVISNSNNSSSNNNIILFYLCGAQQHCCVPHPMLTLIVQFRRKYHFWNFQPYFTFCKLHWIRKDWKSSKQKLSLSCQVTSSQGCQIIWYIFLENFPWKSDLYMALSPIWEFGRFETANGQIRPFSGPGNPASSLFKYF